MKRISHVQGKGSLTHNNREFSYGNVDQSRTKDNITYVKQSLSDAYLECFGEAVERYNAKQKRSDRKIDDYYKSLFGEQTQKCVVEGGNNQK